MTTASTCWKCCAELPAEVTKAVALRRDAHCPSCQANQNVEVLRKSVDGRRRITVTPIRKPMTEFDKALTRAWAAIAKAEALMASLEAERLMERAHDLADQKWNVARK